MRILSIDPSSTATGIAESINGRLNRWDVIRPYSKDPYHRISFICTCTIEVLDSFLPNAILLETTSGKVQARHKGAGSGLAIHGVAVGAVWRECLAWVCRRPGPELHLVLENEWTRRIPKATRALYIAQKYPEYDPKQDPGMDAADAIGLWDWWMKEQKVRQT